MLPVGVPDNAEDRVQKVRPSAVAEGLTEYWSQQVIGSANGNLFKVAKGIGSTTWHTHDDQDETFLLLDGELTIQLRSGDVHLSPGDLFVIPRGVEHCPLLRRRHTSCSSGPR